MLEKKSVKIKSKYSDFDIQENVFEKVICKMAAVLSQTQCVKIAYLKLQSQFPGVNELTHIPSCEVADVMNEHILVKWVTLNTLSELHICVLYCLTNIINDAVKWCEIFVIPLQWHHMNIVVSRHGVPSHWQFHCLCNSFFRLTANKIWKLCITGPLWGESLVDSFTKVQ